jgi:hypothetical protein
VAVAEVAEELVVEVEADQEERDDKNNKMKNNLPVMLRIAMQAGKITKFYK